MKQGDLHRVELPSLLSLLLEFQIQSEAGNFHDILGGIMFKHCE